MKSTKAKAVTIYAVTVVLLCLTAVILFRLDYDQWKAKELSMSQIKLDSSAQTMRILKELRKSSKASYDRHREYNLSFMTDALADYITEDGYAGARLFEDGAVVELRGGEIIWPEDMPAGIPDLSPEALAQGGLIDADEGDVPLASGRIGGDYYYVDWTNVEKDLETRYSSPDDEDFLKKASEPFDGTLLLVSTDDPSLPLVYRSPAYPDVADAAALGFTQELVAQRSPSLKINGVSSMCVYSELEDDSETLICVTPVRTLFMHCLPHVVMVELSALTIIITLCHYLLNVFRYIGSHALTKKQEQRYQPKQLRRTVIAAGLTGALIIFIGTSVFQTLDALHEESIIGAKAFNRLFEQLQETTMARLAHEKQLDAEWYVHHGNQIAAMIRQNPEAGSSERLREYCDKLNIDYLMLFDSKGNEMACSTDYAGFTMDSGLGKNSADFRRLLLGVPSIVHEASTDTVTGLTRQFIGVKVPFSQGSGNTPHGALIMAIHPWQSGMSDDEIARRLHLIESQDILVCYADPGDGRIVYANDAEMQGKTVMEYELPEKSLSDGYTDFVTLRGVHCYVTTIRRSDVAFIYIIKNSLLFGNTLPASLAATFSYLLVMCVVLVICLWKYDQKAIEESAGNAQAAVEPEEEEAHGLSELLVSRERRKIPKEDRTPEMRVRRAIKFDIILLLLLPALFSLGTGSTSVGNGTLFQFLLHGDWNRGLNLFALCSIVIVLIIGALLVVLSYGLLSLIAGFTGKGGETVCRLLYSLVNYIVVLGMLYYVFDYLGLPISTYIASLSVVSLALSLGAQGMVSDILAGLLIVFEGQFRVGDMVEIDGVPGQVLEIGVRSTRLLNSDNDINYYTNSAIRKIVNKSKRDSAFKMLLTVMTQDSMEEVEAYFGSRLPEIGERCDAIIGSPVVGEIIILSSIGHSGNDKLYRLKIKAECKAEDYDEVEKFVKREVYLLCDRESIKVWETV